LVVGLVAIAAVVVGSSCKKKAGSDGDSPQAKPPPAPVPDRGSDDGDDILAFDSLGFTATRTTTCPDLIGKPANGGPPTPLSTALAGARSISLPDLDRHDRALLLVPDARGDDRRGSRRRTCGHRSSHAHRPPQGPPRI
jgi:hypothetical protein